MELNLTHKAPIIHLVSDATGGTLQGLTRACLTQFELDALPMERFWNLIRSEEQLDRVIENILNSPGLVLYTLVDDKLAKKLKKSCRAHDIPCVSVLEPILKGLSGYFKQEVAGRPGGQYRLDKDYFDRMDALDFALHYDDGQMIKGIEEADVILVGCSRTSKTPTSVYLAHRGVKAANIPFVPNLPFPIEIAKHKDPLIVGLTESPARLAEVRRARLKTEDDKVDPRLQDSHYLDLEHVEAEMRAARRLYTEYGWPMIDVTRRSVEETAAEIMTLLTIRKPHLNFHA